MQTDGDGDVYYFSSGAQLVNRYSQSETEVQMDSSSDFTDLSLSLIQFVYTSWGTSVTSC